MKKYLKYAGILLVVIIIGVFVYLKPENKDVSSNKDKKEPVAENKLEEIKKSGKIIMGCNANYPPFEFHTKENGKDEINGFDIMIGKEIAKDLGVELEISDMEFSSVVTSCETGVIDIALSGVSKTAEREKSIDFSDIYYEPKNYLLVNKTDLGKYKSEDDIKNLSIGVQTATIQENVAKNLNIKNIVSLPKTPDLVMQLEQGLIDGIIVEEAVGKNYEYSNDKLAVETSFNFKSDAPGTAVGVKKGEKELLESINKTIKRLKDTKKLDEFFEESLKLSAKK